MRLTIGRRLALLLLLPLLSLGMTGCGGSDANHPAGSQTAPDPDAQPVTLVIEQSDAARTFADIPWSPGMTVLQVMDAAEDADGALSFDYSGSGATALLSAIDGVENQGAGRDAKNWVYWVEDRFATRSFALAEVRPGETVTWRFTSYDAAGE